MELSALNYNADGLVGVVAQDAATGELRMVAHANREALEATLQSGDAHFWSRSRQKLWRKGEESGNVLRVREVWVDCDADAVLYLVEPKGPSCHTGRPSCFFRRLDAGGESEGLAAPTLLALERTLRERTAATADKSYTKSLLAGGADKIGGKLREEADELARAIADEGAARVASEAADVIYHLLVGLLSRDIELKAVLDELAGRFDRSGHEEKASR